MTSAAMTGKRLPTGGNGSGNTLPLAANHDGRARKTRPLRGSDGLTCFPSAKRLRNKGEALVCSLLRYVWSFYEVRRAELALASFFYRGKRCQKPAIKAAQGATLPRRRWVSSLMSTTVLLAVLLGSPSLSAGWGSSGSFGTGEVKKAQVVSARNLSANLGGWSPLGSGNDWVLLDRFERNRPGSRPMREAGFKLPKGSQIDQLYALIGFAESHRKGYDAVHMSAIILPAGPPTTLTLGQIKVWCPSSEVLGQLAA